MTLFQEKTLKNLDVAVIFVVGLLLGMVFANGWATHDVVEGQKQYFVHDCAKQKSHLADKVRGEERRKIRTEEEQRNDPE